jgi:Fe-S oxidoreductase
MVSKVKDKNKRVVLFADTYLNYHEPNVGISALELLNSCGYEVILANVGCCQRPKISHGFLKEAKEGGTRTALALLKYLDQGLKVVVCEPSCASALNDDLPDLINDEKLAAKLKEGVMMIDVFLEREIQKGNIDKSFESTAGDILIPWPLPSKSIVWHSVNEKYISENRQGCWRNSFWMLWDGRIFRVMNQNTMRSRKR